MGSQKRMVERLHALLQTNSHTLNKKNVDEKGDLVATWLDFMDIDRLGHDERGDLLVFRSPRVDTSLPMILLCGHSDTVHPPDYDIPVYIEGDKLYGPGAMDMQGGLVVICELLEQLYREEKLQNVIFALVPDEEKFSIAHRDYLMELYNAVDYAMVFEAGGLYADESIQRWGIVGERKGCDAATFHIRGPGGHSGVLTQPEQRHNTIVEAAHKIIAIANLADYEKGTTTNTGKITGGIASNVIPSSVSFIADYRVSTLQERDRIRNAYETLGAERYSSAQLDVNVSWDREKFPMEASEASHKWFACLHDIMRKKGRELEREKRGGGSDANEIAGAGVVVLDGFGPLGEHEHTPHEFVYMSTLQSSLDLSYEAFSIIYNNRL